MKIYIWLIYFKDFQMNKVAHGNAASSAKVHPMAESNSNFHRASWAKKRSISNQLRPPELVIGNDVCQSFSDHEQSDEMKEEINDLHYKQQNNLLAMESKIEDAELGFSNLNDEHELSDRKQKSKNLVPKHLQGAPLKRLQHPADKSLLCSFFISVIFLVVALATFGPVVILIFILAPICIIVKRSMACCCCCTKNRVCSCFCSKVLSNVDAFWLHDTEFNRSIIQSLLFLEHGLDLGRIRDLVSARLISAENKYGKKLYPRFTQKIIPLFSGYSWADYPDFNMDNHICCIPKTVQTRNHLEAYVSDMAGRSLSMDRPLWEIHVLTEFGEEKDTVVLFRLHPCVSDGISLIRILFRSVVDNEAVCNLKPRFGSGTVIFNTLRALIVGPLTILLHLIFTRKDCNLLHHSVCLSGRKVVAWSDAINLPSVIRIKQVTRSTLNDVLMSVVAGSLRNYLLINGINHPFDIKASVPVDLRSDGNSIKMGNEFSLVPLHLPTRTEGAIPRLWEMKHRLDELKNSADPIIFYGMLYFLMNILPECSMHKIMSFINNKTSCLISNLPGPDSTLTFAAREIKSIMYWMPSRDNVGLSISLLTYADQLRVAVLADKATMPDPEVIIADVVVEIEKLSKLLANRRIPGEHHRRRSFNHEDGVDRPDPPIEELQRKLHDIQNKLQEIKQKMDSGESSDNTEQQQLTHRVEELKEEFSELMAELRRRKTGDGVRVNIEDEELDGELRKPRKRSLSTTSRKSIVSIASTARPLTAPTSPRDSVSSQGQGSPRRISHTEAPSSPSRDHRRHGSITHEQIMMSETTSESLSHVYLPQIDRRY